MRQIISVIFYIRKLISKRLNNLLKVTLLTRNRRSNPGSLTQRPSQCTLQLCVCERDRDRERQGVPISMCAEARGELLAFFTFFLLHRVSQNLELAIFQLGSVQVPTVLPLSHPRTGILDGTAMPGWNWLQAVVSCPVWVMGTNCPLHTTQFFFPVD